MPTLMARQPADACSLPPALRNCKPRACWRSLPATVCRHNLPDCRGLCSLTLAQSRLQTTQVEVVPGVLMPTVGYGTAGLVELTADAVFTAIRTGYRLVDSAQVGMAGILSAFWLVWQRAEGQG